MASLAKRKAAEKIKKSAIKAEKKSGVGCTDDQPKLSRKRKAIMSQLKRDHYNAWSELARERFFDSDWYHITTEQWASFHYPGYEGITIFKKIQFLIDMISSYNLIFISQSGSGGKNTRL